MKSVLFFHKINLILLHFLANGESFVLVQSYWLTSASLKCRSQAFADVVAFANRLVHALLRQNLEDRFAYILSFLWGGGFTHKFTQFMSKIRLVENLAWPYFDVKYLDKADWGECMTLEQRKTAAVVQTIILCKSVIVSTGGTVAPASRITSLAL